MPKHNRSKHRQRTRQSGRRSSRKHPTSRSLWIGISLLAIGFVGLVGLIVVWRQGGLGISREPMGVRSRTRGSSGLEVSESSGLEVPRPPQRDGGNRATGQAALSQSPVASGLTRLVTQRGQQRARELESQLDPNNDGWYTEVFSDAQNRQLKLVVAYFDKPESTNVDALESLIDPSFRCQPRRPTDLVQVYRDKNVLVRRLDPSKRDADLSLQGANGFASFLQDLTSVLGSGTRRASLKTIRVEEFDDRFETLVSFQASGRSKRQAAQINSTWQCTWNALDQLNPRLTNLRVLDSEEVILESNVPTWMSDCTSAVLSANPSYHHELLQGMDYWVNRLDRRLMVSRFGHHGITIGDVNGDGLDDVYVCQPGGLPNRLYVRQPDGTAKDMSATARVDVLDYTSSAILVDLDNDGDQDLILATAPAIAVLANDGTGTFAPSAAMPDCHRAFSLAVADYDADGRLDVFACRYRQNSRQNFELPLPVPYYDANNGGRNFLFRNLGNWQFEDVSTKVGLNTTRFSFAAAWEDYDNDGDPDLYVANDYGRNCLYRNDAGRFTDVAAETGVEDIASGMSVTWSDYNHDGRMDLYVSNMFSSAGNRITFQPMFRQRYGSDQEKLIQRHARGNSLFENIRTGSASFVFRDVSDQARVTHGRWAWASLFADINNDSWDDLLVVNGLMTTLDTGDL